MDKGTHSEGGAAGAGEWPRPGGVSRGSVGADDLWERGRGALPGVLGAVPGWKTRALPSVPLPSRSPSAALLSAALPSAAQPGAPGTEVPSSPLLALVGEAGTGAERAAGEPLWRLDDTGLRETLGQLGRIRSAVERLEVRVAAEVLERGVASAAGFSPVDWIGEAEGLWGALPDPRHVATVVAVATATRQNQPGADVLEAALSAGVLSLAKAAQIARFTCDVRAVADAEAVAETVETLVGMSSDDQVPGGTAARAGEDGASGDATGADEVATAVVGAEGTPEPEAEGGAGGTPRRCRGLTSRELAGIVRQARPFI